MADGDPGAYSDRPNPMGEGPGEDNPVDEDWPPQPDPGGAPDDEEMPLADHIEEMVRRLGVVIVVMAVISGIVFPFGDRIINFLWFSILPGSDVARPHLYHPLALILARLKVATLVGFVVALPVFVYETYLFMRPGLYPRERRYYLAAVPTSIVLAAVGVSFAYFLVLPAIFTYFLYYTEGAANIAFGLTETFDLIILMLGFFAVVFQIPLFVMLAIMMGLTTRRWLADRRLYFWGGFAGIAFLFSPDPTGMAPILVAATMIALFEGTLLLLRWLDRDSLAPSPAAMSARRPQAWLVAALAGYLASGAPLPAGYYGRFPPALTRVLADFELVAATPLLVGGGLILLFEAVAAVARRTGSGRRRVLRGFRIPVWLGAIVVGYLASPDPVLIRAVEDVNLAAPAAAAVAVGLVALYEGGILAAKWVRR